MCRTMSTSTSPASTSSASTRKTSLCWRTMRARPPACPTCWKTARSSCGCFPTCFSATAAPRRQHMPLANEVGPGMADGRAVCSYMPEVVKFYLGEDPVLKNVPTWHCRDPKDLAYVPDNLAELVVKEVHGSGGYGILIGPAATKATIEAFRDKLKREPEGFIAQPTLALSTCPTCTESGLAPRHVDLRPFVLTGRENVTIVPGGLTRVALKEGSLVVNSSQGGGTKDTWILDE